MADGVCESARNAAVSLAEGIRVERREALEAPPGGLCEGPGARDAGRRVISGGLGGHLGRLGRLAQRLASWVISGGGRVGRLAQQHLVRLRAEDGHVDPVREEEDVAELPFAAVVIAQARVEKHGHVAGGGRARPSGRGRGEEGAAPSAAGRCPGRGAEGHCQVLGQHGAGAAPAAPLRAACHRSVRRDEVVRLRGGDADEGAELGYGDAAHLCLGVAAVPLARGGEPAGEGDRCRRQRRGTVRLCMLEPGSDRLHVAFPRVGRLREHEGFEEGVRGGGARAAG